VETDADFKMKLSLPCFNLMGMPDEIPEDMLEGVKEFLASIDPTLHTQGLKEIARVTKYEHEEVMVLFRNFEIEP
jgi:hypothetical protein